MNVLPLVVPSNQESMRFDDETESENFLDPGRLAEQLLPGAVTKEGSPLATTSYTLLRPSQIASDRKRANLSELCYRASDASRGSTEQPSLVRCLQRFHQRLLRTSNSLDKLKLESFTSDRQRKNRTRSAATAMTISLATAMLHPGQLQLSLCGRGNQREFKS